MPRLHSNRRSRLMSRRAVISVTRDRIERPAATTARRPPVVAAKRVAVHLGSSAQVGRAGRARSSGALAWIVRRCG